MFLELVSSNGEEVNIRYRKDKESFNGGILIKKSVLPVQQSDLY